MTDAFDEHSAEEIARGAGDFVMYLEECDSQECVYTYSALMESTVVIWSNPK